MAPKEAEAAGRKAARIDGPGAEDDVPEEQRPVVEGGGDEAAGFEQAEEELVEVASHGDPARTIDEQLDKCLADVHSIEEQALTQLRRAPDLAGDERLAVVFERHLAETNAHEERIRRRLESRGADTSAIKDIAGKAGGLGMVAFAQANPDTPGKLTAHAFSYEHMEVAAYELLRRTAERAGDAATTEAADAILVDERAAAERIAGLWDTAIETGLAEQGIAR